jgi:hypothetical protein
MTGLASCPTELKPYLVTDDYNYFSDLNDMAKLSYAINLHVWDFCARHSLVQAEITFLGIAGTLLASWTITFPEEADGHVGQVRFSFPSKSIREQKVFSAGSVVASQG